MYVCVRARPNASQLYVDIGFEKMLCFSTTVENVRDVRVVRVGFNFSRENAFYYLYLCGTYLAGISASSFRTRFSLMLFFFPY